MNNFRKSSKQDIVFYPKCEKTNDLRQKILDIKDAIVFLKLRHEGCKKREAIHFSSKTICKVDTSKCKDGPANCRKLKPLQTKGLQINGWELSQKRDYEMGQRFRNLSQLGIRLDEEEAKITNIIEDKMKSNSHDYLYRIKILDFYLQEIEKKCSMPKQNQKLLLEKIDKLLKEIHEFNEQPAYFMSINGVNLYEIFQDYPKTKEEKDKHNNNFITLFDSFSNIYNKEEFQSTVKYNKISPYMPSVSHSKQHQQQQQQQQNQILQQQQGRHSIGNTDLLKKNSFSYQMSSRNSLNSSKILLQLNEDSSDDGNEQVNELNNSVLSYNNNTSQTKLPKNTILQRQQTKSIFNTLNSPNDKKEQPFSPTSRMSTPKLKFIDLKSPTSKQQTLQEQNSFFNNSQLPDNFLSSNSSSNTDQTFSKCFQDHKITPLLKQMEFPQKLDWLIDNAINHRQKSPQFYERDDQKLNQQIQKVQQCKQKLEKKTMNNFYDSSSSFGFKTHSEFFKSQKKFVKSSYDRIFTKQNLTNYSNFYSTGVTSKF